VVHSTQLAILTAPLVNSDNLSARVHALRRKQQFRNVSESPTKSSSPCQIAVPDLTPLPPRPHLQPVSTPLAPATDDSFEGDEIPTLAPSPPASKYAHLLQEAVAISLDDTSPQSQYAVQSDRVTHPAPCKQDQFNRRRQVSPGPVAQSIGNQLKGFLWSYLPIVPKAVRLPPKSPPSRPGLPVPPREVLERPRGPISTPVRPRAPRPTHPKDLVHLQPAPPPKKPSLIPRASKPKRLVELHPPPPATPHFLAPRPRKSSVSSVKDIVRSFEERETTEAQNATKSRLKPVRSVGDLNRGNRKTSDKPAWKP